MGTKFGKIAGFLFFAVIGAGAVFLILQYMSEWHEQEIKSALELQRKQFEANYDRLDQEIRKIEKQLEETRLAASVPEARITEVFGKTIAETDTMDTCAVLEERIASFFNYIDENTASPEENARELFFHMMADLAEKPPIVIGETRDLITLLRNRAHFFRVLKKERIDLVRHLLQTEKDILEAAMADFYDYYGSNRCAKEEGHQLMPMPILYDYAGFFLETISGKSYLMRRESTTRSLSLYYSVLMLDRAVEEGLNRYGIDIREHIGFAKDNIRNQGGLANREQYMAALEALERKYR